MALICAYTYGMQLSEATRITAMVLSSIALVFRTDPFFFSFSFTQTAVPVSQNGSRRVSLWESRHERDKISDVFNVLVQYLGFETLDFPLRSQKLKGLNAVCFSVQRAACCS